MSDLTPDELALVRRLLCACSRVLVEEERIVVAGVIKRIDDVTPLVCEPFISAVA